jgi:ABC-2 type transport system ATP-binding protein
MVTVSNLRKSFGITHAVSGLSFTVKPGEILGLLGPNGAGKTTTMRMMTGFLTPDSGSIDIEGVNVVDNPREAQQKIGYLPENNPLYKDMLVGDMLSFSADLKNLSGSQKAEAVDFAVRSVSIEDVYYRPIFELSKGYKQRVGVAIALLHKPKVLIMDEPSEGLDPNQRSEVRALIKDLAKNHTIIISTHVMQEVEAVCSRMLIINKGMLVADGTPRELMRKSGADRELDVEIQGKSVEQKLKHISGVESVLVQSNREGRVSMKLMLAKGKKIQPDISKLASENGWVIWRLAEEERQLEDVFHILTGGNV